ncbi:hypothetical protein [Variovorax sp. YR216]|uniref:hypothetical protein n=1 Tax=Variovorax sp. YR216 TaxID=1882828 RepID=UPI00089888C9|nr:hypothetical protein [Variovorax sp. YR216]SEB09925.1 hypothetical protein SAMN05444680_107229 [Variovorax sp. YR216]
MNSESLVRRSDARDATGEVLPGDIITSRVPLDAGHQQPTGSTQREPIPAHRTLGVTDWPEWMFFAVLAVVFLTFGGAIFLDKESRELPRALASVPLVLGELHPQISHVVESAPDDGALEITLLQASPMYPASVVAEFASDALVVLQRMHEFFPKVGNRVVRFVAKAPLHPADADWEGQAPVLSIDFERSEVLAKVVAPEFTSQDLLNHALAIQYLNDVSGPRYVEAFCRDEVSRSAEIFCERELGDR